MQNMKDIQSWNACVCVFLYFINLATFSLLTVLFVIYKKKNKVFPLQARCGPEGG